MGLSGVVFLRITRHFEVGGHSDFSVVWAGSKLLLQGRNPYALIGPGKEVDYPWELHYPASTLVAVSPLTLLSETWADVVFVFFSAAILCYVATKENWNRLWIFPSCAFIIAARSAQWSPLICTAFFLPFLGWVTPLKPSLGLAVFSVGDKRTRLIGVAAFLVTASIALLILPEWPRLWLGTVSSSWEYTSPVRRMGGFLLVLSLIKWRQREARFLFVLALVPQVSSWYEGLLPLLVGRTKRECQILSLVSSAGFLLLIPLAFQSSSREIPTFVVGRIMIAFCYLPALVVVLRRGDEVV